MKKIPRLFVHKGGYATEQISDLASWLLTEDSIPFRKWDGTPMLLDKNDDWWARRIVRHSDAPPHFHLIQEVDGIQYGWVPVEHSSFVKPWAEAVSKTSYSDYLFNYDNGWQHGTYELIGPKIAGNEEKLDSHWLMPHRHSPQLSEVSYLGRDINYHNLKAIFKTYDFEGCVWYDLCGRKKVKLRRKDFQWGR